MWNVRRSKKIGKNESYSHRYQAEMLRFRKNFIYQKKTKQKMNKFLVNVWELNSNLMDDRKILNDFMDQTRF